MMIVYGVRLPTHEEAQKILRAFEKDYYVLPWDGLASSCKEDCIHFSTLTEEGIFARLRSAGKDCNVYSLEFALSASGLRYAAEPYPLPGNETIPTRAAILREAERLTCGDRNAQYGPPEKNFRDIAAGWSLIIGHEVSPSEVALCMAWLKILRATTASGVDSETDGAAYLAIAAELRDA